MYCRYMESRFKKQSGDKGHGGGGLSGCRVPNRYPNQQPKEELLRLDPSLHEAGADPVDGTEESK